MGRTFLYARVSTAEQTTDNQLLEVQNAGFTMQPRHIVAETISGSVPAADRPGFAKLLGKLDEGDTLVVTNLIDWAETLLTCWELWRNCPRWGGMCTVSHSKGWI